MHSATPSQRPTWLASARAIPCIRCRPQHTHQTNSKCLTHHHDLAPHYHRLHHQSMAPFRATPSNYRVALASLARAASLVMCVCYEPTPLKSTVTGKGSELTKHCVCTAVRWRERHRWKAHHGTQQEQGPQVVRRALVTSSPKPLARQNLGQLPNDSNSSMFVQSRPSH